MSSHPIVPYLNPATKRTTVSVHRVHRRHVHYGQGGPNLGGKLGTYPEGRGRRRSPRPLQEQPSSVSLAGQTMSSPFTGKGIWQPCARQHRVALFECFLSLSGGHTLSASDNTGVGSCRILVFECTSSTRCPLPCVRAAENIPINHHPRGGEHRTQRE